MQGNYDTVMNNNGIDMLMKCEEQMNSRDEGIQRNAPNSFMQNRSPNSSASLNEGTFDFTKEIQNDSNSNGGGGVESGLLRELEASSQGKIKESLLLNYFKYANQPCTLVFLVAVILLTNILAGSADVWVSYWYARMSKLLIFSVLWPLFDTVKHHFSIRLIGLEMKRLAIIIIT